MRSKPKLRRKISIFLPKIIEAYDNLGIVSTMDRNGLVIIRGTADTIPELEMILKNLPFPLEIIE